MSIGGVGPASPMPSNTGGNGDLKAVAAIAKVLDDMIKGKPNAVEEMQNLMKNDPNISSSAHWKGICEEAIKCSGNPGALEQISQTLQTQTNKFPPPGNEGL